MASKNFHTEIHVTRTLDRKHASANAMAPPWTPFLSHALVRAKAQQNSRNKMAATKWPPYSLWYMLHVYYSEKRTLQALSKLTRDFLTIAKVSYSQCPQKESIGYETGKFKNRDTAEHARQKCKQFYYVKMQIALKVYKKNIRDKDVKKGLKQVCWRPLQWTSASLFHFDACVVGQYTCKHFYSNLAYRSELEMHKCTAVNIRNLLQYFIWYPYFYWFSLKLFLTFINTWYCIYIYCKAICPANIITINPTQELSIFS